MSVQSSLRRVRVAPSPVDLNQDATTGFVYPRVLSVEVGAALKTYGRAFLASDHDHFASLRGEKEATLKIALELCGFGGSPLGAGVGAPATDGESGLLLQSAFGSQTKDSGTAAAAGSTEAAPVAATPDNLTAGGIFGWVDPATGLYHARQLRSKAGATLNPCRSLPAAPTAGDVLYASAWYAHATQGHPHLWFDVEGYDPSGAASNWRRYVRGCLGDLALTLAGQGKMEFDLKGIDWSKEDGVGMPAPVYPANLPAAGMFLGRSTRVWLGAAQQVVTAFSFKLGNDVQPKPSMAAPNGVAGFFVKDAARTFEFTALHDDGGGAFVDTLATGALLDLLVEGTASGPGNSCAIAAPAVEITDVKPTSVNGLDAYTVSGRVLRADLAGFAGFPDVVFALL